MAIQRSRRRVLATLGAGTVAGVTGCLGSLTGGSDESISILVYSGAGLKKPMDEIGKQYEDETGTKVNYNYAGSNTLLSQIELKKEGDVYMPGAKYYIDKADEKGFVDEKHLVAYHTPVISVPDGNPADVQRLEDLTNSDVEVAFGDPEACAIGRLGEKILKKNGLLKEVEKNIETRAGTTNQLVVYLSQDQADAAITWKADLHGLEDKTTYVMIPEEKNIVKTIPIGVLDFSEKKSTARDFVEFVASDTGRGIFADHGYIEYEGDASADLRR